MENNKNDLTPEVKNNSDEIVFAGNDSPKSEVNKTVDTKNNSIDEDKTITFKSLKDNPSEIENNSQTVTESNTNDEDIVFAYSEKPAVNQTVTPQQKKSFPLIPVIAGSVSVVCIAVVGVLIAIHANNNASVPAVNTESSTVSSISSSISSSETLNTSNTSDVIQQQSFEIKQVDTSNIVFGKGVTVEGVDLTGMTLSDAYYAMNDTLDDIRETITITIKCDGKTMSITENDFEFDTDISDVLLQAYHYSRNELVSPTVATTQTNGVTDFNITSQINSSSIKAVINKVKDKFNIEPVNAHVESFNPDAVEKFTYADGSNGYLLDEEELTDKINNILAQPTKTGSFSIETVETPYTISLADIKANTKLIASHATTANNVANSNHNMKLAIKSANGIELKPGETFSFNGTTGDTTTGDLGYLPSTAIVNGKYEQQYGGGICQASTTLYICALKADMEIVERYAHQYPSSYADRGLDATVDYGNLDMKFKNTGKYSIFIATYTYDYNYDGYDEIMVEMYGSPSTEYDEIVPVGWVTWVGSSSYSAMGAKVYFKDGKEIKREYLPSGSYDFKYESADYIYSLMPNDTSFGPKNVYPTMKTPTVYSPGGNGSNSPVPYGTAGEVQVEESSQKPSTSESSTRIPATSSKPSNTSSVTTTPKPESSVSEPTMPLSSLEASESSAVISSEPSVSSEQQSLIENELSSSVVLEESVIETTTSSDE